MLSVIIITLFDLWIVPHLASRSPFKLATLQSPFDMASLVSENVFVLWHNKMFQDLSVLSLLQTWNWPFFSLRSPGSF